MKNIVVLDEYNEIDLKPSALFDKYLALVQKDVAQIAQKKDALKNAACPGCTHAEVLSTFEKFGLKYNECARCRSLYISPRPDDAALNKFFTQLVAETRRQFQAARATTHNHNTMQSTFFRQAGLQQG